MNALRCIAILICLALVKTTSAQTLKLITYNIRLQTESDGANSWTNRKDFLTGQLKFYNPDVFGVQEALPQQVDDLTKSFVDYSVAGSGRDGFGKGESSNIFYRKDRFILKDSGTFWLSETPGKISKGWDAALNRVCTYVLLKDKQTKKTFWVFNTHMDHIGEIARTKSIDLILHTIDSLNAKKYPVVLMGDFNSEPQTPRISALREKMSDARLVSEQPPFGPDGTFNGFKHDQPVMALIDYIFVSKFSGARVLKYAVLSDSRNLRYPSDHLPVYAELSIGK
jgi:endonuclease/exonuclease/phosphatase family metal-dependent hydrolase